MTSDFLAGGLIGVEDTGGASIGIDGIRLIKQRFLLLTFLDFSIYSLTILKLSFIHLFILCESACPEINEEPANELSFPAYSVCYTS